MLLPLLIAGVKGDGGVLLRGTDVSVAAFYTGAGVFALAAVVFVSLLVSDTLKKQKFSVTSMMIVSIAGLAYLTMAFGFGRVYRDKDGAEIYYARYVDWALTTPLLLYDACTLAGATMPYKMVIIFLDILMILLGLFGALTNQYTQTWAYFALGCVAFLPILYFLLMHFRRFLNPEVRRAYGAQMYFLSALWFVYPVVWALSPDGASVISSDAATIWYLILDVTAKAVYGSLLLTLHRHALPYAEGEIQDEPADHRQQPPRFMDPLSPGGKNRLKYRGSVTANAKEEEMARLHA